ncbi:ataxin-10 [Punica granatum]|uniref:Ataxin-10 domain-containing protein n=2 Tax=Punica granatum TaxID=22663 RepID=A0A218W391_PUNGR|nr:ataxin-10 [Punica granatum]OWM67013.1 hypothetical protein CDL15_Pgr000465 [Punica granatum]PKI44593.1 hypothetical protein CRG98_034948 [Punica granatum]
MGNEAVEAYLPEEVVQPLLSSANASSVREALEALIETSRTAAGRSGLASKNILAVVLRLTRELWQHPQRQVLVLSLKFLRNLCAGEVVNQDLFVEQNGVKVILEVLRTEVESSVPNSGIIRMGLQVLANVSLAGEKHQSSMWMQCFPNEFLDLARVRSRETIDPLCMIVYACSDGNDAFMAELCGEDGLGLVAEIVRTVSAVGFGEMWFKLLLSRICLEGPHLPSLFSKLCTAPAPSNTEEDVTVKDDTFSPEQAYLLSIVAEILNERLEEVRVSADIASFVFEVYERSVGLVEFHSRRKCGLPTGVANIDVLGYSLTILRDVCAQDGLGDADDSVQTAVLALLSRGLLDFLLDLLRDLEPPAIVRKAIKHVENEEGRASVGSKVCPYGGFRRDLVAVIANCSFRRRHVQDEIREKGGIPLLLQQCVTDEDNPFLREWGLWAIRNLLLDNPKNQQEVSDLKLEGSVDVPEVAELGLRVELDPRTGRPKLVNCPRP